jgi:hypothetical protein
LRPSDWGSPLELTEVYFQESRKLLAEVLYPPLGLVKAKLRIPGANKKKKVLAACCLGHPRVYVRQTFKRKQDVIHKIKK